MSDKKESSKFFRQTKSEAETSPSSIHSDSLLHDTDDAIERNQRFAGGEPAQEGHAQSVQTERKAMQAEGSGWQKRLKWFGGVCMAAFVVALGYSIANSGATIDADVAKQALSNRVSTSLSAGAVLLSSDETLEPQDHTIEHQWEQENTMIWVWDYAAEDGDYVQVLVDGAPIGEAFMIKHKPRQFTVPAVGLVQIRGIRDGGGGITYAVRYELNGTTYFNAAPEGEQNTYTLVRK